MKTENELADIKYRPEELPPGKEKRLRLALIMMMVLAYFAATIAQTGLQDINFGVKSDFQPSIKDALKFSDLPEIKDSVKRLDHIAYGISSRPLIKKYEVQPVEAAKLQNEALGKLYHSLLKLGYGPFYNMPYGEFLISSTRARQSNYSASLKHQSGTPWFRNMGNGAWSDNSAEISGKKYYKKHTLDAGFNYSRNALHYFGYDTALYKPDEKFTRQRYQLFEPTVQVLSHYTDSSHINHDIRLSYYNLQNLHNEIENNIRLKAAGTMFINREKFNLSFLTDYYNHRQSRDTINDLIMSLTPSFEAGGDKWRADLGLNATVDNFGTVTKFYFYPRLNLYYDIYDNILIPYAGINGGLIKNSMKSLSRENPFVDTSISYANTDNKYCFFGGFRGNLSSNTSFDTKLSYSQLNNLYYYVINYDAGSQALNRFKVLYYNTALITVSGELKYQAGEKLNLVLSGNYYSYKADNIERPYHKPSYDFRFTGVFNMQSKIILRAGLTIMGNQWALTPISDGSVSVYGPRLLSGWADANLECEYRYSKMLGFFARFNNIANQRYYRWDHYPVQGFNMMIGLSFVPF